MGPWAAAGAGVSSAASSAPTRAAVVRRAPDLTRGRIDKNLFLHGSIDFHRGHGRGLTRLTPLRDPGSSQVADSTRTETQRLTRGERPQRLVIVSTPP